MLNDLRCQFPCDTDCECGGRVYHVLPDNIHGPSSQPLHDYCRKNHFDWFLSDDQLLGAIHVEKCFPRNFVCRCEGVRLHIGAGNCDLRNLLPSRHPTYNHHPTEINLN